MAPAGASPRTADVIVLGAGAAGMMCAVEAGRRGRRVTVIDHAASPGEKIRISGGGRCNFTNLSTAPDRFLSGNPRFAASALARYTPQDFIAKLARHAIAWHEKTLGQLFCDGSARDVVAMLVREMAEAGVDLRLSTDPGEIGHANGRFRVAGVEAPSLVVATGGKSIPKMGATGLAYDIARRFGLGVTATRPALVPLTFAPQELAALAPLAGVALPVRATCGRAAFDEAALFTHRGLSGPAILQISSYWREGEAIMLDLLPGGDAAAALKAARAGRGRQGVATVLCAALPRAVAQMVAGGMAGTLADQPDRTLAALGERVHRWTLRPVGTEGYRTAEVTLGGVDTAGLDSRTMAAKSVPGLHVIGEAVDVTGWLGGYNFQWAWASGWAAGQVV